MNACGEESSDVDVALWFRPPPEGNRQVPSSEILKRLAAAAPSEGLEVLEKRLSARKYPICEVGLLMTWAIITEDPVEKVCRKPFPALVGW